mmetsp:Transcript_22294/g.63994  ORF Transcript_22294/g.63994 Transcript_22294/m.63994 type:complete len:126 (+) Transcript_22294:340-717(+)
MASRFIGEEISAEAVASSASREMTPMLGTIVGYVGIDERVRWRIGFLKKCAADSLPILFFSSHIFSLLHYFSITSSNQSVTVMPDDKGLAVPPPLYFHHFLEPKRDGDARRRRLGSSSSNILFNS